MNIYLATQASIRMINEYSDHDAQCCITGHCNTSCGVATIESSSILPTQHDATGAVGPIKLQSSST